MDDKNNINIGNINNDLLNKYNKLKEFFKNKSVVISYSGGSDSLLVSKIASLYSKNHIAITIDNGFFKKEVIINSKLKAEKYGINHKLIEINYFNNNVNKYLNKNILKDIKNRCYYCKKDFSTILNNEKEKLNYDIIVDGTNISDLNEHRPGIKAYREMNIISPLVLFNISKNEVYKLLNYLNMSIPKKDSCLATRILTPNITKEKLKIIENLEDYLLNLLNLKEYFRVRLYYNIIIIEITYKEYNKLNEKNIKLIKEYFKKFKKYNFEKCCFEVIENK